VVAGGYVVAPGAGYVVAPVAGYVVAPVAGYVVAPVAGYVVAPVAGYVVAPGAGYLSNKPSMNDPAYVLIFSNVVLPNVGALDIISNTLFIYFSLSFCTS